MLNFFINLCWLIRVYFFIIFTKKFSTEINNPLKKEGHVLTFYDEFKKDIDWEHKWNKYYSENTETPNDKIQKSSDCIKIRNKVLHLYTKPTTNPDFIVKTGYLNTKGKFSQKYGFIEYKIKATSGGKRWWNAGWMLVANIPNVDPYYEIDLFEFMDIKDIKRKKTTCVSFHLHFPEYEGRTMIGRKLHFLKLDKYYHTISIDWTEKRIIWRLNNIPVFRVNKHIPNVFMSLIVNNCGWKNCSYTKDDFPAVMLIDSIKCYKKMKNNGNI